jgi:hypothetical protein
MFDFFHTYLVVLVRARKLKEALIFMRTAIRANPKDMQGSTAQEQNKILRRSHRDLF